MGIKSFACACYHCGICTQLLLSSTMCDINCDSHIKLLEIRVKFMKVMTSLIRQSCRASQFNVLKVSNQLVPNAAKLMLLATTGITTLVLILIGPCEASSRVHRQQRSALYLTPLIITPLIITPLIRLQDDGRENGQDKKRGHQPLRYCATHYVRHLSITQHCITIYMMSEYCMRLK